MTLQANVWTDKAKFIGPSDRAGGQKKEKHGLIHLMLDIPLVEGTLLLRNKMLIDDSRCWICV